MAEIIYLLCGLTSLGCAGLLLRSYARSRAQLLLWSSLCFVGLFANNVLLFVDLVLTPPEFDLSMLRACVGLVSVALLNFGLIWSSRSAK